MNKINLIIESLNKINEAGIRDIKNGTDSKVKKSRQEKLEDELIDLYNKYYDKNRDKKYTIKGKTFSFPMVESEFYDFINIIENGIKNEMLNYKVEGKKFKDTLRDGGQVAWGRLYPFGFLNMAKDEMKKFKNKMRSKPGPKNPSIHNVYIGGDMVNFYIKSDYYDYNKYCNYICNSFADMLGISYTHQEKTDSYSTRLYTIIPDGVMLRIHEGMDVKDGQCIKVSLLVNIVVKGKSNKNDEG